MTDQIPAVRMKGVGSSLWVTIAPDIPFDRIKDELVRLFDPLKHLAASTRVVLDTGPGQINEDRHHQISAYLKDVFHPKEIVRTEGCR